MEQKTIIMVNSTQQLKKFNNNFAFAQHLLGDFLFGEFLNINMLLFDQIEA